MKAATKKDYLIEAKKEKKPIEEGLSMLKKAGLNETKGGEKSTHLFRVTITEKFVQMCLTHLQENILFAASNL